jgi:tetratricopeptide (TPR) repeat protein
MATATSRVARKAMAPMMAAAMTLAAMGYASAQDMEHHDHPAPERLGAVSFPTSCSPAVKPAFDRALALLHSFTYALADKAFADVAARDPACAMAHWGMAMTHYHQLWDPPTGEELRQGAAQVRLAETTGRASPRERQFIEALAQYYRDADQMAPSLRAQRYAQAMSQVARTHRKDDEAQIFYALALIATALPTDKTHANQKRAADILAPIWRRQPQHPGLPHYLIHAYDSAELAPRGLAAARAYSKIAPAAPHALHMPSHIFTRLGLWDDSIASNIAARAAAHAKGDVGEELHAMDYLTYAYLQRGRYAEAGQVVNATRAMTGLRATQFKIGYAASAMPIRLAIERKDWDSATRLEPLPGSPPAVAAIVYWARAVGHARARPPSSADDEIGRLEACRDALRSSGDSYWATQADAMIKEAQAWRLAAAGQNEPAIASLRAAADEEDAAEKLPVTPGPIVPAREQLGEMLLQANKPDQALHEFKVALTLAPGRRGALVGAMGAAGALGDVQTANRFRAQLQGRAEP